MDRHSFIFFERYRAEVEGMDRDLLRSKLAEASSDTDIDFSLAEMTGESEYRGVEIKHEWEIEKGDGNYVLIEEKYVQKTWYYLIVSSFILTLVGSILFIIGELNVPGKLYSPSKLFGGLSVIIAMFAFKGNNGVILYSENLVTKLRGASESYTYQRAYYPQRIVVVPIAGLLLFGYGLGNLILLLLGSIFSLCLLYWLKSDSAGNPSEYVGSDTAQRVNSSLDRIGVQNKDFGFLDSLPKPVFPVVVGDYVFSTFMPIFFPLFLIGVTYNFGILGFYIAGIGLYVIIDSYLTRFLSNISGEFGLKAFWKVKQNKQDSLQKKTQLAWFALVVVLSYSLIGVLVGTLYFYREAFYNPQKIIHLAIPGVVILVILPIFYFIAGIIYQTVHWVKEVLELAWHSSQTELEFDTKANVYAIKDVKDSPHALSTGFSQHIFIPSKFINEEIFGKEELEAIVAHEEKHLLEREALLFFYMPFISLLLFTGQNVLYALLNFPRREYKADQYAKNKVGEDAIISALQKAKLLRQRRNSNGEDSAQWQNYFGLFYGTFAHSKAHPDIEERIDQLKSES